MYNNLNNFDSSPNSLKDLNLLNSSDDSDIFFGNNTTNHNLSESNTNACTSLNLVSEFTNKELIILLGNNENTKVNFLNVDNQPDNSNNSKNIGRKRKNDETEGKHNKFSKDITLVKIKTLIINQLHKFINRKIEIILGNDVGEGLVKKTLMKLNGKQNSNANIEFNRNFLNKTLQDIFSENVTSRISLHAKENNKIIIDGLINDKNEKISNYFKGLFNLTFFDCLKYFRGENISIEYLKGLSRFSDYKRKNEEKDKDYIDHLSTFLQNYEKNLFKKEQK